MFQTSAVHITRMLTVVETQCLACGGRPPDHLGATTLSDRVANHISVTYRCSKPRACNAPVSETIGPFNAGRVGFSDSSSTLGVSGSFRISCSAWPCMETWPNPRRVIAPRLSAASLVERGPDPAKPSAPARRSRRNLLPFKVSLVSMVLLPC